MKPENIRFIDAIMSYCNSTLTGCLLCAFSQIKQAGWV